MTIPFARPAFPEIYEQALVGPLFRPFAELIIEDLEPAVGDRVLDVACGTGIVARLAAERLGAAARVVGVDLNPAMLDVARSVAPGIDWRVGDAGSLPLHEGERFDVVACQQGLQFVPDRLAAAREMRRALAPGGRAAVSTWRPDEELPLLWELRRVAERHVGPIADRRHSLGDGAVLEAVLRQAGFLDVSSKIVSLVIHFAEGALFVRLNAMAMVGMSAAAKELGDDERERIVAAIGRDSEAVIGLHTDRSGLAYEIRANVATARG